MSGPIGLQKSDYVSKSFEVYEAQCDDSDWLKYVELRAPIPSRPATKRLLIVDLKEGVGKEIGYEQLFFHYGEEDGFNRGSRRFTSGIRYGIFQASRYFSECFAHVSWSNTRRAP